jgi:hypothetical protein
MIEENEKWFEKSEEKQSGISISRWIVVYYYQKPELRTLFLLMWRKLKVKNYSGSEESVIETDL